MTITTHTCCLIFSSLNRRLSLSAPFAPFYKKSFRSMQVVPNQPMIAYGTKLTAQQRLYSKHVLLGRHKEIA